MILHRKICGIILERVITNQQGPPAEMPGVLLKGEKNAESKWNFNARIFTSVQIRDRMFLKRIV